MRVIVPPAADPVSLAEAKAHLRIDNAADDADLLDAIAAARTTVERLTNRTIVDTTIEHRLDGFPSILIQPFVPAPQYANYATFPPSKMRNVSLPRGPAAQVLTVQYLDLNGTLQTLTAGTDYVVTLAETVTQLAPPPGNYWPATYFEVEAVRIQYVAGLAATVTAVDTSGHRLTMQGRSFSAGDAVQVFSCGTLPAALQARQTYYVVNPTNGGQTVQLAATANGAAIAIADAGIDQLFLGKDFGADWTLFRRAIKLLIGDYYENREAQVMTSPGAKVQELPRSLERVLEPLMPGDEFTNFEV